MHEQSDLELRAFRTALAGSRDGASHLAVRSAADWILDRRELVLRTFGEVRDRRTHCLRHRIRNRRRRHRHVRPLYAPRPPALGHDFRNALLAELLPHPALRLSPRDVGSMSENRFERRTDPNFVLYTASPRASMLEYVAERQVIAPNRPKCNPV